MSLADKLNYTIDAKLDIQRACIFQGVDLPDNAPFGDYGKYIRLFSSGGGFTSSYEFTCIADNDTSWCLYISILLLRNGVRNFTVYFDNVLLSNIDATDISSELNKYVTFTVSISDVISAGIHNVKVIADNDAQTAYVAEVLATFPISKYCQTVEGMTNIAWSNDDGANSFTLPDDYKFFYYAGNLISTIFYSGNSYIGLNSNSENIRYNLRDTYVNTFYHQLVDMGIIKAIKLHWVGWSPYGDRDAAHLYQWEVFLFSNGDAMIVWCSDGGSTTYDGAFNFLGTTYNRPTKANPYVTFYRQDTAGSSWQVDYDVYVPIKSKNIFS